MIYIIYDTETKKDICQTDEFKHAFTLMYQFNEIENTKKYDIRKD